MKYRTKGIRRRRDTDKWEFPLIHTDPLTGEDVTTYHTIEAKNEKQAKSRRADYIIELEVKGLALKSSMTIKELLDKFVDYKEKSGSIEPSTIQGYRGTVKRICKYIGSECISDLSIQCVNDWMAKMKEDGFSPRTIIKAFRLLKQALNYAIAEGLINKNPCNFCKPPKKTKTPINALPRAERSRMLELARDAGDTPLAYAIILALTTGMRRGELCALRWSDFDEERATITVSHSMGYAGGGYYEKEPKSSKPRTIPLTKSVFCMLSAKKSSIEWLCNRLKVPVNDTYILGTVEKKSRPYSPDQIGKDFAAFCKMNKFDCTLHDLRHTFATYMIGSGVDVRTVASYLGHANVSMTLDVYADVDPEAKFAAVDKIEDAFDDPLSVYYRESKKQLDRLEQRQAMDESSPSHAASIPAEQIPFTEDELKKMLETVQRKAS